MQRVIVTGGAGFIGSHLCDRLLNEGNYVICIDNFFTGSEKNILKLLNNKNFELIKHDITNPIEISADQIYNLACPASPVHYQLDPINTLETSIVGAKNMLELAKKNSSKILQASTSEVYGDPRVHPQTESYWGNVNPIGIRACYDEGKRCAETYFFDYYRQYNTTIRVVRIFNTYGPNMHPKDGRVVSNFIVQALKDKDLTIYGDGSQTRSFQYIEDLIEGICLMMNNQNDLKGPVNIGNPDEFTIKQLAEKVLAMIPESKSKIIYKALPQDDPKQRKPNIDIARDELGWKPKTNLEQGLEKTINYFRNI